VLPVKGRTLETLPHKSPAAQLVMSLLMETMRTESLRPAGIRELPIVAGNLALDFANTVDDPLGPQRFDHVADYQSLAAWSQRIGTVSAQSSATLLHIAEDHPRHAQSTVRRGKDLRAAINETFGAIVEGHSPDTGWRQLRPFVAEAIQHAGVMSSSRQLSLAWDSSELDSPLWPVAEAAFRLLIGPEMERLKRCVACPWLFVDRSKNHSRRWCSMEICGTDEKMRRYVTKRADRR
jgi:predicted RNA-binding Zn ribbon-like protein